MKRRTFMTGTFVGLGAALMTGLAAVPISWRKPMSMILGGTTKVFGTLVVAECSLELDGVVYEVETIDNDGIWWLPPDGMKPNENSVLCRWEGTRYGKPYRIDTSAPEFRLMTA